MVQTGHSVAKFAYQFPNQFQDWMRDSEYLISLEISNEEKLKDLYYKLKWHSANVVFFSEPDISNQWTSICFLGTPEMRKHTNKLNLSLKNSTHGQQMVNV